MIEYLIKVLEERWDKMSSEEEDALDNEADRRDDGALYFKRKQELLERDRVKNGVVK